MREAGNIESGQKVLFRGDTKVQSIGDNAKVMIADGALLVEGNIGDNVTLNINKTPKRLAGDIISATSGSPQWSSKITNIEAHSLNSIQWKAFKCSHGGYFANEATNIFVCYTAAQNTPPSAYFQFLNAQKERHNLFNERFANIPSLSNKPFADPTLIYTSDKVFIDEENEEVFLTMNTNPDKNKTYVIDGKTYSGKVVRIAKHGVIWVDDVCQTDLNSGPLFERYQDEIHRQKFACMLNPTVRILGAIGKEVTITSDYPVERPYQHLDATSRIITDKETILSSEIISSITNQPGENDSKQAAAESHFTEEEMLKSDGDDHHLSSDDKKTQTSSIVELNDIKAELKTILPKAPLPNHLNYFCIFNANEYQQLSKSNFHLSNGVSSLEVATKVDDKLICFKFTASNLPSGSSQTFERNGQMFFGYQWLSLNQYLDNAKDCIALPEDVRDEITNYFNGLESKPAAYREMNL